MIILAFAVSDNEYYNQIKGFLLNRNRLNVMISRAKTKVVILKSNIIDLNLN
jgi:superfamily I DNA and/or RNA helicase